MGTLERLKTSWAATAQRTKGVKIVWAAALALGLFQFGVLGLRMVGPNPSVWSVYVWPYLSTLLLAALVVVVALVSGILIRPQRPERLATGVGAVGAFIVLVLPAFLPVAYIASRAAVIVTSLLFGIPFDTALQELASLFSPQVGQMGYLAFASSWIHVVPLAVSCWLGANYWRSASWRQFWRGPGGAILKGGLVAGAICAPLSIATGWWRYERLQELREHLPAGSYHYSRWPGYPWASLLVSSPGGITTGALIAALLVSLRPKPLAGAFAGSGLVLGLEALSLALYAWTSPPHAPYGLSDMLVLEVPHSLKSLVLGAIAGSFAGRWEDEPIE